MKNKVLGIILSLVMMTCLLPYSTFAASNVDITADSFISPLVVSVSANETTIYNFLKNTMGLNTAAACGVLANIEKESSFSPTLYGDGNTSYGICQWHDGNDVSRFTALKTYCSKNGYDYTSLTGQLYYLQYELSRDYPGVLNYLKNVANNSDGAYNAGEYWCLYFEVPADKVNVSKTRGNLAKDTYWPRYGNDTPNNKDPGKPALKNMQSNYAAGKDVTFSWDATVNTTHYNLYFDKKDASGNWTRIGDKAYATSGYTRSFDEGSYRVLLQSTNKNYWTDDGSSWRYTDGNWVSFTVAAPKIWIENASYPTTITEGDNFALKGTIKSNNYTKWVFMGIYQGDTKLQSTEDAPWKRGEAAQPFSIEKYSGTLDFSKLKAGDYRVTIHCMDTDNNYFVVLDKNFKVIPVLTIQFNANGGTVQSSRFSTDSAEMIKDGSSNATNIWTYGYGSPGYGLWNADSFGLTRNGYVFSGWSLSRDGSSTIFDQDDDSLTSDKIYPEVKNASATVTLYAVWKAQTPTPEPEPQPAPDPVTEPAPIIEPDPVVDPDPIVEPDPVVDPALTKPLTVYYDANGGSGAPESQTVTMLKGFEFPSAIPVRTGYSFKGWFANQECEGEPLSNTLGVFAFAHGEDQIMLYAGWTPNNTPTGDGEEVHFEQQTIYFQGQFTDVPADKWFTESVASAFEFSLMKGNSDTTFNPYGDVTIAEAITMASRIHSIYTTGGESFVQSDSKWYQVYLDYAYQNGIINKTYYNCDVTQKATRAQFAEIFSKSLPDKALFPMNNVANNAIPDVSNSESYAPFVYKLYRAGILAGNDAKGTFSPETYITRAESAAIVSRMAESNNRVVFSLQ